MKVSLLLPWLGACVVLVGGPAPAQTPAPKPSENLSEKLDRTNGVLHPKDVDPGIEKPTPKARDPNVIEPPAAEPQPK